jgi:hypothetical protein
MRSRRSIRHLKLVFEFQCLSVINERCELYWDNAQRAGLRAILRSSVRHMGELHTGMVQLERREIDWASDSFSRKSRNS